MSEVIQIPRSEWENMKHKIDFLVKAIQPLAKGYKPSKWMSGEEVQEYLNIGPSRLKQLKASGAFLYRQPANGRCTEYDRKDIEDYKAGRIVLPNKKAPAVTEAHSITGA